MVQGLVKLSRKLTIFEGPDGSGKTTAAKRYAAETGARYVHFPALPQVNRNLARMYVEAMLPALLGYQDVVFDRCWLSELPYGVAFREGKDRLTEASRRMLVRLALRCGAVVVRCNPGWELVQTNYLKRKHMELLDNDTQLREVFDLYEMQAPELPELIYSYTDQSYTVGNHRFPGHTIEELRTPCHPLGSGTAGNLNGRVVLVGESFAERKDNDAFYQWPFASFSHHGCSQWLTDQLTVAGAREGDLLWLNADQHLELLHELKPQAIFALGEKAYTELYRLKISAVKVPHPQAWKRFNAGQPYPLTDLLQEVL